MTVIRPRCPTNNILENRSRRLGLPTRGSYASGPRRGERKPNYGTDLRWSARHIEPASKKERAKNFAKEPDTEAHKARIEHSRKEGSYIAPEVAALTMRDALEAWFNSKKKPGAASLAKYRNAIDNYVVPRWQGTRLSAVQRPDVDNWVAALQDGSAPRRSGMRAREGGLSASLRGVLVPFSEGLGFAVLEGWIRRNPAEGIETPPSESEPIVYLTHEQLEALVRSASQVAADADALMVGVMGNVGPRIGELLALTVGDVDMRRRRISVHATMTTDNRNRPIRGTRTKTPSGTREVPIPPHLVDGLRNQTRRRASSASLFPSTTGTVLSASNRRNRVWSKAIEGADPRGPNSARLRHTAASLAIAAGADVLMVQRMLGHADAKETLNTYAKLFPDRMDEITERMSKARDKALRKCRASQDKS
jgi:integrase